MESSKIGADMVGTIQDLISAQEKVVLVTGGATGIGGMTAEGFGDDVSTGDRVATLAAEVHERADRLEVLVDNAGRGWGAPFGGSPFGAWGKIADLNVAGLFTLTRDLTGLSGAATTPASPARGINIGSVMGTAPLDRSAWPYAAPQAAAHQLTRVLAIIAHFHASCGFGSRVRVQARSI